MNITPTQNNKKLAELLFADTVKDVEYYRKLYPARDLPAGAFVTRVAPSPTGFMHIGGIYMALISRKMAHQSNGVFFLRIEDTDKKREIEGAKAVIVNSLKDYGLLPDEGSTVEGEIGAYAPYTQSERLPIYQAFLKHLVLSDRAYPCFATEEEISAIRAKQELASVRPGYYGEWAIWRDADIEKVEAELQKKTPFVLRLKSAGKDGQEFTHPDLVKGDIVMPVNNQDFVLMKSDGLPTYHIAHVVDDYLMGTTHVLRADEWVSSIPLHYELWSAFDLTVPRYGHMSPIVKIGENGGKRKLSKRSDPEASVLYYKKIGYPEAAVIDYLMNLANSNYEDWRKANPLSPVEDFVMTFENFNKSGSLFDEVKLRDIAMDVIARMDANTVFDYVSAWAKEYDSALADLLAKYSDYSKQIFGIERGDVNARKDLAAWSDVSGEFAYFYDKNFEKPLLANIKTVLSESEMIDAVKKYIDTYDPSDEKDTWMNKIRTLAGEYKLSPNLKTFKQNPELYRGQVGELTKVIRFALTGREKSPDLHSMMKVMGKDRCVARLKAFIG